MATIKVMNASQINPEAPVEIKLTAVNPDEPAGVVGIPGPQGKDGKSAYDIAVKNGFNGNELQWLASLKGTAGAPGAKGDTPIKGVDYFTEEDIQDFIEQIPAPDLSDYNKNLYIKSGTNLTVELRTLLGDWNEAQIYTSVSQINGYNIFLDGYPVIGVRKSAYYGLPELIFWCHHSQDNRWYLVGLHASSSMLYPFLDTTSIESLQLQISASQICLTADERFPSTTRDISAQFAYIKENYATKDEVNTKQGTLEFNTTYNASTNKVATMADISNAISNATSFGFEIVNSLPTTDISTSKIYLVFKPTSGTNQIYTEYIYVNGDWEIVGDTQITVSALSSQEVQTIWNTASTT